MNSYPTDSVEDNKNQQVARLILEQLGYRADVGDGPQVLQSLRRQPHDVVGEDVQKWDGLTATRQIYQEWLPGSGPGIIAMTVMPLRSNWQARHGSIYISKPDLGPANPSSALSQCQPMELGSWGAGSYR